MGRDTVKVKGCGATCSERVAGDTCWCDVVAFQTKAAYRGLDLLRDVFGGDVCLHVRSREIGTQHCGSIGGVVHDVFDSSNEGFDGTGDACCSVMVDDLTTLAVFLIGDV